MLGVSLDVLWLFTGFVLGLLPIFILGVFWDVTRLVPELSHTVHISSLNCLFVCLFVTQLLVGFLGLIQDLYGKIYSSPTPLRNFIRASFEGPFDVSLYFG